MNCLLLFPEEEVSPNRIQINGSRADELILSHDLKAGLNIRVSLLGKGLGRGEVLEGCEGKLEIKIGINERAPERENIEIIAAVPRPQTVKKILHLAAAGGIRRLNFIKAELTDKSYLQSKSLLKENIQSEMHLAIEQSVDYRLPEISIHTSYYEFIKGLKERADLNESIKLFADAPRLDGITEKPSAIKLQDPHQYVTIAIGPEGGWSEKERTDFRELGFTLHSLGRRLYRSETACAMLLGQIMAARHI